MESEEKIKKFSEPLNYISNPNIKRYAEIAISNIPDYFFSVAASSTGKYHPSYALGEGGLYRHTLAATKIAKSLLDLEMLSCDFSNDEKDLMIVAIILHDSQKRGFNPGEISHSEFFHPIYAVESLKNNPKLSHLLSEEQENIIYDAISSHMGQWNESRFEKETLPKPQTRCEKFVHMVDYLASRKFIEINFYV
jgi:hypothetical protein